MMRADITYVYTRGRLTLEVARRTILLRRFLNSEPNRTTKILSFRKDGGTSMNNRWNYSTALFIISYRGLSLSFKVAGALGIVRWSFKQYLCEQLYKSFVAVCIPARFPPRLYLFILSLFFPATLCNQTDGRKDLHYVIVMSHIVNSERVDATSIPPVSY